MHSYGTVKEKLTKLFKRNAAICTSLSSQDSGSPWRLSSGYRFLALFRVIIVYSYTYDALREKNNNSLQK